MSVPINHYITASGGVFAFVSHGMIVAGLRANAKDDGSEFVWGDYFGSPFPITWYNSRPIGIIDEHRCPNTNPYEARMRRRRA